MKPCKYFNQCGQYILNIANDLIPIRNKRKYSYEYYLTNFNIVLSNGIKWQCLETTSTAKNHWKTIYNEFNTPRGNIKSDIHLWSYYYHKLK